MQLPKSAKTPRRLTLSHCIFLPACTHISNSFPCILFRNVDLHGGQTLPGVSIIASNSVDEAAEDANPDAASPIVSKKEFS